MHETLRESPQEPNEKLQGPYLPSEESDSSLEDAALINEAALIRKLDWRLLPAVSILYLLSFLDRSNVANARIEGLLVSIHATGNQYLTGLTLYFIGYVIFEIPCNIILKKTTPRFWLPTLTIAFGVVATLIGVVQNLAGFFVVRFFLGVVESGLFPGVVFYLSMWYKRRERQFRVALFFSAASLAGAFGGILAYGIAFMRGVAGLPGWRWIFIIEGVATVVIGFIAYLFIPNYPSTAKFLTPKEKAFVVSRLAADSDAVNDERFTWGAVAEAMKDPKVWLYAAAFHTMSLPLYTLSLFLPTIIKALGYSSADAQLLSIPPYALATMLTLLIAWGSERVKLRSPFVIGSALFAIIGYCLLLSNQHPNRHPAQSYVGVFFAAGGIYPATALSLSWPATNVGGQTKRAIAAAMQISIGNLGAVIGTQLYRGADGPRYIVGHSVALGYLVLSMLNSCVIWWYLKRENRKRDAAHGAGVVGGTGGLQGDADPQWRFVT